MSPSLVLIKGHDKVGFERLCPGTPPSSTTPALERCSAGRMPPPSSTTVHGESRVERGLLHKGQAASPSLGLPPSSSFTLIVLCWLGLSVEHHSFCLTALLLLFNCIFHLHSLFPARNCVCRPSESISLLQQLSCLSTLPGYNIHLFVFHLQRPPTRRLISSPRSIWTLPQLQTP